MLQLYQCWQYYQTKHAVLNAKKNLEIAQKEIEGFENEIEQNIGKTKKLDEDIKKITSNANTVS